LDSVKWCKPQVVKPPWDRITVLVQVGRASDVGRLENQIAKCEARVPRAQKRDDKQVPRTEPEPPADVNVTDINNPAVPPQRAIENSLVDVAPLEKARVGDDKITSKDATGGTLRAEGFGNSG
jgi:hypothetical protein